MPLPTSKWNGRCWSLMAGSLLDPRVINNKTLLSVTGGSVVIQMTGIKRWFYLLGIRNISIINFHQQPAVCLERGSPPPPLRCETWSRLCFRFTILHNVTQLSVAPLSGEKLVSRYQKYNKAEKFPTGASFLVQSKQRNITICSPSHVQTKKK